MNNEQKQQSKSAAAFKRVLDAVAPDLGQKRIDSIESTLNAGEAQEAFSELVSSLFEKDVQVSLKIRVDLSLLAKALDLTDYEHGKGKYW